MKEYSRSDNLADEIWKLQYPPELIKERDRLHRKYGKTQENLEKTPEALP